MVGEALRALVQAPFAYPTKTRWQQGAFKRVELELGAPVSLISGNLDFSLSRR
jgi:hypothetical protein